MSLDKTESSKQCIISLQNIKKTYIMGEVQVPVLHGINLDIYKGELTVVLGASGSGKSTLINMIGGIDRPSDGQIVFNNNDIAKFSDHDLTEYRRNNIGFVFQFYNLVPTLTSKENVEVSTEVASDPMDPVQALELVDMSDKIDHFPAQLSGGQQQRVSIARALAKKPEIMLCDEPTGALDSETGQMVLQTLIDLNDKMKTTIVIITHASSIAKLAHRIVHLGNGIIQEAEYNQKRLKVKDISW